MPLMYKFKKIENSCRDLPNHTKKSPENMKTNAINHISRNHISASIGRIIQENALSSAVNAVSAAVNLR